MAPKEKLEAQNPLILRSHRLMEAFAKSDDERDFYLDRLEGFIVYVDLNKPVQDVEILEKELSKNADRYCPIPKLTFYETKKIMEGFVNEKVYDIDTKEKLLDIIQSKDARTNFLEFIYDHHTELDKWQQFYQERSRIRIIEWLRNNHFHFVFEEDLEFNRLVLEKLKQNLFLARVGKDILNARKTLIAKAKTYYSNEALNPRPKRGRPPKQVVKQEVEPQFTTDIYTTVPVTVKPFLFTPDITSASGLTFSSKFESPEQMAQRRSQGFLESDVNVDNINQKLALLRNISSKWVEPEKTKVKAKVSLDDFDDDEDFDDEDEELNGKSKASKSKQRNLRPIQPAKKAKPVASKGKPQAKAPVKAKAAPIKRIVPKVPPTGKVKPKRIIPKAKPVIKTPAKAASKNSKAPVKSAPKAKIIPKAKVAPAKAAPAKANAKRRLQPVVKRGAKAKSITRRR